MHVGVVGEGGVEGVVGRGEGGGVHIRAVGEGGVGVS